MDTTLVAAVAFVLLVNHQTAAGKIVCYYGSWAVYRPGNGKFDVEDIDPFICTHLSYGFAGLDPNTSHIYALDPWNDLEDGGGKGAYKRFNALKSQNPELKTFISIGGWNEGSEKYSKMAADDGSRKEFAASCVTFVQQYGFDGLDLDWEYPASRGGALEDKQNYPLLLKELRQQFEPHQLLLTAAVSAGKSTIDGAYDVPAFTQYLDFINMMTYDYHGSWDNITGCNTPLRAEPNDTETNLSMNVEYSINYWLQLGAPAEKLILGLASYGRSFTLQDTQHNSVNQPIMGPGTAGPYTREPGSLGYNEICESEMNSQWSVVWDDDCEAPYAYQGNQWVSYDNAKSIAIKCKLAAKLNLGGVMMWSIETDDFQGICSRKKFPLLSVVNKIIKAQ